jgi:hypothetical protein
VGSRIEQKTTAVTTRRKLNSVERDFIRSFNQLFVVAPTMPFEEVTHRMRALERHYLSLLENFPDFALEIRRRMAEMDLELSLLSFQRSLAVCRNKLQRLARLGYQDVERKAHFEILFVRGAIVRGHKRVAKRHATQVAEELRAELKKRKSSLAEHCLAIIESTLRFIETKRPRE